MTEYRMLRASDIPEAVEISKRQLGVDYLDDGDFEDAMFDPGQFCVVAEEDGRVAGFSICQVFGPELEGEKLMLPDCPERDMVMSTPLTGLLDSVAVSADFKGKGIGTELGRRCIEEMRARGCGIVCAMAWKPRRHQHSQGAGEAGSEGDRGDPGLLEPDGGLAGGARLSHMRGPLQVLGSLLVPHHLGLKL